MTWLYSNMEKIKGVGLGGTDGTRMGADQDKDEIRWIQLRSRQRSYYMGWKDEGRRHSSVRHI